MENKVFISLAIEELKTIIIDCVKSCLNDTKNNELVTQSDQLLTIEQASKLLNLKVSCIYGMTHRREIPFMKQSKRLYFSKNILIEWIHQGQKMMKSEILEKANYFQIGKKKGEAKCF